MVIVIAFCALWSALCVCCVGDPFLEDPATEAMVGSCHVYLQPLAFMVEIKEQLELVDFRGTEVGILNLEMVPCNKEGKEYVEDDDVYLDSPSEMIGKECHFVVRILNARGLPARFTVSVMPHFS